VIGIIQVFQRFVAAFEAGQATPDVFAEGIWTALITTAYGLMVAIPMMVLYKTLQGRNDRLVVEMEEDALGIVGLLDESLGRQRAEAAAAREAALVAAQAAAQTAGQAAGQTTGSPA
jgi:biopolymer transport protein ExbB